MLRKAWLAFSASAMLGAAAIASNAALAQPFPAPSPAVVLLVALVLAVLLVLGPPTFLVLPASEAVVLASAAVWVPFTAAPGAMRTATPPTIAMAAQAMPTAADAATPLLDALWRLCRTANPTLAAAVTPTSTATGFAHTRVWGCSE
jgi:hypothetical protein